ncbi:uncharacterized protein LOC130655467 [Hydractinia symbiolongicarpus]|uniref:uncharacterized protein LOC130655467 n=1 Tax=Hydractinia symbiolongicarpus TaxID=13093 RepID=UPI00255102B8|nr:uncharacterized protein LOC130655467 [Hydractinia symbiolongicarpus]
MPNFLSRDLRYIICIILIVFFFLVPETRNEVNTEEADVPKSTMETEQEKTNDIDNELEITGLHLTRIMRAPSDITIDEIEMDSNTKGVCFSGGTAYEQMLALKSSIESKKIIVSRFPEFESVPLTDVLLKDALHTSVNDEIIYTYLQILTRESNNKSVNIINPGEMAWMFDASTSKMKQRGDISKYDLIVGCRCNGYHWTFSVVIPSAATIIYFNPMGELSKELVQVIQQWNSYLSANYGVAETFRVEIVPHARQQDSVSCGIFCVKPAECLILSILQHGQEKASKVTEMKSSRTMVQ